MRVQEVARFESAGDVRTVSLVQGDDGLLEVRELREGPSAVAVYGESEHSLRVLFAPEAVPGLLGAMAGGAIPLVLRALGRDPAQASSIFLTALTDSGGFFIFLGLATAFLL